MNKVILCGRLVKDPTIQRTADDSAYTRFTIAVDRPKSKDGTQGADFIPCVAFGHRADFVGNYFKKGQRILITGRIQVSSYTNKDSQKVWSTEVLIDEAEFVENKPKAGEDFMDVPKEDGLPFN